MRSRDGFFMQQAGDRGRSPLQKMPGSTKHAYTRGRLRKPAKKTIKRAGLPLAIPAYEKTE